MPQLKIRARETEDDRDGSSPVVLYIQAVMLFPTDEAKREAYWESAEAKSFLEVIREEEFGNEQLPASTIKWALNAPSFEQLFEDGTQPSAWSLPKAGDGRSILGGVIAAYMILIPLVMHFRHSKSVGRRAAYRVLYQWLVTENKFIGAAERNLQTIWRKYQSCSHLWAAFVLLHETPKNSEEILLFLSLSELIRYWAEQYHPERSPNPLLDERVTWKLPTDFPLADIEYDLDEFTIPDEWVRLATSAENN